MSAPPGKAASINQKPVAPRRLPDFRNLGISLRLLLIVHALAFATVLIQSTSLQDLPGRVLFMAGRLELPLFLVVLTLYLVEPMLSGLRYAFAAPAVMALAAGITLATEALAGNPAYASFGATLWAAAVAAHTLAYFDHRSQRLSPSLAEARLQALTVRMRPHFLFNSLNAVLGVIRSDPRRAEQALEEMSDVFRAVMKENRELIPLGDELELCERYLGLERLRLGERLAVRWQLEGLPRDALIPPLMLQPLLENAVYHGIEPLSEPGEVGVTGQIKENEVLIEVSNPQARSGSAHAGNRMALDNIRERLMLFYDLEASISVQSDADRYCVRLRLPYRRKGA